MSALASVGSTTFRRYPEGSPQGRTTRHVERATGPQHVDVCGGDGELQVVVHFRENKGITIEDARTGIALAKCKDGYVLEKM